MLVLSRKNQEAVVVGSADGGEYLVRITVIEIRGSRVKLGFEAADEIRVHRFELWEQMVQTEQSNGRDGGNAVSKETIVRWENGDIEMDRPWESESGL